VNIDPLSLIRPHILDMPAYEPILPFDVLSRELGIPQESIVKLDANENPYGTLPEVRQVLADLDQAHIYPDPESRRIRGLLADYHQISSSSLVIGAGADELIDLIMRLTITPGDGLVNCPPTFGMYAFDGAINGAEVISVPRRPDFTIDRERLLATIAAKAPKLLFLAHPNNPDGGLVAPETIEALLAMPLLLILDEAYINFGRDESSWIGRVADFDNLIVLRTFSKWAGLAGLRIGYGVFPEALVPLLMKSKQPYNVSVAAEAAACVSIEHVQTLNAIATGIVSERERLKARLNSIRWLEPYPSQANFILCRVTGRSASRVKAQLMARGILIRFFDKPGLSDHIRISVGKPEQNDILIEALRALE
jgi:histidinol-phosphate aminotransferase